MRKIDPEASTMMDIRTPEEISDFNISGRGKISTSSALALDPKQRIQGQRSSTRGKIILFLTAFGLGAGSGSYGTYRLLDNHDRAQSVSSGQTDMVPRKVDQPAVPPAVTNLPKPEASANEDYPGLPDTSEKLWNAIKSTNTKVNPDDFSHANKFINVLVLTSSNEGDGKTFKWAPMSQKNMQDEDLLIAVRLEKPEYKYLLKFVARQPVSTVEDESDPLIVYAYYKCTNSDNKANRVSSIAIVDPKSVMGVKNSSRKRPAQYLTTFGFTLPRCDAGKEPDRPE